MGEGLNKNNEINEVREEIKVWPLSEREQKLKDIGEKFSDLLGYIGISRSPIGGGGKRVDENTGEFSFDGKASREYINFYPEKAKELKDILEEILDLIKEAEEIAKNTTEPIQKQDTQNK